MFLNISGANNPLFKLNENDIAYVEFKKIISILPQTTLKMKGNCIFYSLMKKQMFMNKTHESE